MTEPHIEFAQLLDQQQSDRADAAYEEVLTLASTVEKHIQCLQSQIAALQQENQVLKAIALTLTHQLKQP